MRSVTWRDQGTLAPGPEHFFQERDCLNRNLNDERLLLSRPQRPAEEGRKQLVDHAGLWHSCPSPSIFT